MRSHKNTKTQSYIKIFIFCCFVFYGCSSPEKKTLFDWRSDWALEDSFSLRIDSEGFRFPTSIAFVPRPGLGAKDPLYFVTELGGLVKVVTNDRTVHTFAENFFRLSPKEDLPSLSGEVGMAGICLDASHGYVFVTFAYQNEQGLLYNNIERFTSTPETFSLSPTSHMAFTDTFSSDEASVSHQIGNCQVVGDSLFVGVGDGERFYFSQRFDSVLGKILRMTLDGKPIAENPFYQDDNAKKAANYIFAYGLRNPFGIRAVGDRLFVSENGPSLDRFLEVKSGENYLWDGNNFSMGIKAASVLPSVGLVQTDYHPEDVNIFPQQYRKRFYIAASGRPDWKGRTGPTAKGILSFDYDLEKQEMRGTPKYLAQYRGDDYQSLAGVAFGPDALYFAPLFPNQEGKSYILKITYDPAQQHPHTIGKDMTPEIMLKEKGCLDCHSQDPKKEKQGPSLHQETLLARIQARLQSSQYRDTVKKLDQIASEPYRSQSEARKKILQTKGVDQVRLWLQYHLMEPKFDNPNSQMPNLGLTKEEAQILAKYLIQGDYGKQPLTARVKSLLQAAISRPNRKHVVAAFLGGMICSFLVILTFRVGRVRK